MKSNIEALKRSREVIFFDNFSNQLAMAAAAYFDDQPYEEFTVLEDMLENIDVRSPFPPSFLLLLLVCHGQFTCACAGRQDGQAV